MSKKTDVVKDLGKKGKGLWADFKAFAFKGNVVDMAVGVIIATAFSGIVSSLVNDVFTPILSWIIGSRDFSALNITLREATLNEAGEVVDAGVSILLGSFLQQVIDFLIMAFIVFLFIRLISKLMHKKEEEPAPAPAEPEPTKEEVLLTEIRDLLKKQSK